LAGGQKAEGGYRPVPKQANGRLCRLENGLSSEFLGFQGVSVDRSGMSHD
jgi:hypothetical protein